MNRYSSLEGSRNTSWRCYLSWTLEEESDFGREWERESHSLRRVFQIRCSRGWDGVWGASSLWGINICEKKGMEVGFHRGRCQSATRPHKASAHAAGSPGVHTARQGVWCNCSGHTFRNPSSIRPWVLEGMTWGEEPAAGPEDARGWRLSVTTLHSGQKSFLRGEPDCASLCESQHVSAWRALMPRRGWSRDLWEWSWTDHLRFWFDRHDKHVGLLFSLWWFVKGIKWG